MEALGGTLTFYPKDGRFTAECSHPLHGKCVVTRFNRARSKMKGRPLGFLSAWLACGPLCESKEDHWRLAISEVETSLELRQEHRRALLALEQGPQLLRCEKDSGLGLEKEPAGP